MQTIVLPEGSRVVYCDDEVAVEHQGVGVTNLVLSLFHLILLSTAHFEIAASRRRREKGTEVLVLENHPLGLFFGGLLRKIDPSGKMRLPLPYLISIRPGVPSTLWKTLIAVPAEIRAKDFTLDSAIVISKNGGGAIRLPYATWNKIMLAVLVEMLAPLSAGHSNERVPGSVRKLRSWELLKKLPGFDSRLVWILRILYSPFLWIRGILSWSRLGQDAAAMRALLSEALVEARTTAERLGREAAETRDELTQLRGELDRDREQLGLDREQLRRDQRKLAEDREQVARTVEQLESAHKAREQQLLLQVEQVRAEAERLRGVAEEREKTIDKLRQQVRNFEISLEGLQPKSEE